MRDDDRFLRALGEAARHPLADPAWEKLAAGELSREEAEALRRRARDAGVPQEALDALRPRDAAGKARIVDAALDALAEVDPSRPAATTPPVAPPPPAGHGARSGAAPAWRRPRVVAGAAAAIAMAAMALLWLRPPAHAPVAHYEVELIGGDRPDRSPGEPPEGIRRFGPGARIAIKLSPVEKVEGAVTARVFLVRDGRARPWHPPIDVSPEGIVEVSGTKEEVFGDIPDGRWEMVIAVGSPEALPDQETLLRRRDDAGDVGYRVYRWVIELVAGSGPGGEIALPRARSRAAAPPALEVEIAGCGAVLRHGQEIACEVPESGEIKLWANVRDGAPAIAIDGRRIDVAGEAVQGGMRFRIPVAPSDHLLSVARPDAGAPFRLALRPPDEAQDVAVRALQRRLLREVEELSKGNALEMAAALVAPLVNDPSPRVRAEALGLEARMDRKLGRATDAIAKLKRAAAIHAEEGRISDALRDELAVVYISIYEGGRRFDEAREALARCRALGASAEHRVRALYYEGLIAAETGDYRAALQHLRAAVLGSERLGLEAYALGALQMEAELMLTLGRERDARALVDPDGAEHVAARFEDPCQRADYLNNVGYIALAARDGDRARTARVLEASRALYEKSCEDLAGRSNVATNLALLAVERGRPKAAQRWLAEAQRAFPEPDDPRIPATWHQVNAWIALQLGDPAAALRAYGDLADLAKRTLLPTERWRAAYGRAQALEALGRDADAKSAYAEAERLLEDRSLLVPAHEGRGTFLGRFDESAKHRVDFLIDRAPGEAAEAARAARARSLATLQWLDRLGTLDEEERARWEKAVAAYREERDALVAEAARPAAGSKKERDEARALLEARAAHLQKMLDETLAALGHVDLGTAGVARPAPRDGELFLVYHPIRRGWAGIAVTQRDAVARRLGEIDARAPRAELAQKLLAPFAAEIAGANRVRILAYGELDRLDFHALPWGEGPLLASLPVTYGIDLPRAASAPAAGGGARGNALLIVDPEGNLASARLHEGPQVQAALEGAGWRVAPFGGALATHARVRDALRTGEFDLMHYAGHGLFAGRDGWGSYLRLADDELTVSDILTLPRAPAWVVLSGCETARTAEDMHAEGLGLAHAFVIAGAEVVVAATRPVGDEPTARVMSALYAPPRRSAAVEDAAERLREAELAARRDAPGSDWASFRVLVP